MLGILQRASVGHASHCTATNIEGVENRCALCKGVRGKNHPFLCEICECNIEMLTSPILALYE